MKIDMRLEGQKMQGRESKRQVIQNRTTDDSKFQIYWFRIFQIQKRIESNPLSN